MKAFRSALVLPALFLLLALPASAVTRAMPALEGPPPSSIEGTITSINIPFVGEGPLLTLLDGLITFDATGATVRFASGAAGTTADFAIGQRVVAFVETTTAMPKARSIVILSQRNDVTLTGAIQAIDPAARTLTVLGFAAKADGSTVFGGPRDGDGLTGFESLQVGDFVLLAATSEGRTLVAKRVMKLASSPIPVSRIHGTVGTIGTDAWTIVLADGSRSTVKVDAETKVVGDPKVGDEVDVLLRLLPDGSVLATLIVKFVAPPTVPTERYQGIVKSISPTSWTIGPAAGAGPDRLFAVNEATRILGDPKVGDAVGVLAQKRSDGSFLAVVIAKETVAPPVGTPVAFEGTLNRIDTEGAAGLSTWLVGETKVLVTRMTTVAGAPKVGDTVRVEGFRGPDGVVMAARIAKL